MNPDRHEGRARPFRRGSSAKKLLPSAWWKRAPAIAGLVWCGSI